MDRVRLVLLSFLMLFTELLLIRWSAAFVIYISYFTNFVLLSSFLGIGVGFLRGSADRGALSRTPILLAGVLAFVALFPVQVSTVGGRSLVGLFGLPALPIWIVLPVIFALVVAVMESIGAAAAAVFGRLQPLTAYRLDVSGSLLGIVTFAVLSFLQAPPVAWGLLVSGALVLLLRPSLAPSHVVGLGAILVVLGVASFAPGERWSPYYLVTTTRTPGGILGIRVNGLPHQAVMPIDLLPERQPFYLYPYRHLRGGALGSVLIVGAGNGNDVEVALSQGARHVDAVEIDPVILSIGQHEHPDRPYSDPRVTAYVDDGRAFLERSRARYDVIEFALPDSLTLVSGQAALRLESYLFTVEALRAVRDHLEPGGAFTMYNYYRPDVLERFAGTIDEAFGHEPCVDLGPGEQGARRQAVLTVGRAPDDIVCSTPWAASGRAIPEAATDDHPFPYLRSRSIPLFYLRTLALMLVASVLVVRRFGGPLRTMRPYADLFLMGAAFLLLETKNVVQFALLFGTTWFVNALVFSGILLAVLGAIEAARRVRLPAPGMLHGALLASLLAAWAVRPEALLALPVIPRFAAATALAFGPVFLANLIFAQRFRDVASSTVALGANLLGAMVGGVLEYAALVVGYRDLLAVVAALYLGALLSRGRIGAWERRSVRQW